jgi:hypothetical protein
MISLEVHRIIRRVIDPAMSNPKKSATYERADLILHDLPRIQRLLADRWQPIQIIFAGKAHTADDPSKHILQKVFNACRDPQMVGRVAFVEDCGELTVPPSMPDPFTSFSMTRSYRFTTR